MRQVFRICIFVITLGLFACSVEYYTLEDASRVKIGSKNKYLGIGVLKVTDPAKSPIHLKPINLPEHIKLLNLRKNVVLNVFIDTRGRVSEVYLIKSVNSECDNIAVQAVKNSRYKPIQYNNQWARYQFFVSYTFADADVIYPVLNGDYLSESLNQFTKENPQSNIYEISDVSRLPETIYNIEPTYPLDAIAMQLQGEVVIQAVIDEFGNVIDATVIKHMPILFEAALETVYQLEFKPALIDSHPVKVKLNVPIHYEIPEKYAYGKEPFFESIPSAKLIMKLPTNFDNYYFDNEKLVIFRLSDSNQNFPLMYLNWKENNPDKSILKHYYKIFRVNEDAQKADSVFASVSKPPHIIRKLKPMRSETLYHLNEKKTIYIKTLIDKKGEVLAAELYKLSGSPFPVKISALSDNEKLLIKETLYTCMKTILDPAEKNGRKVSTIIIISFNLPE